MSGNATTIELLPGPEQWEWSEDLATDLEVYVQLSRVGHFDRATKFYERYLQQYENYFLVAMHHGNALLDQSAFGKAKTFLSRILEPGQFPIDHEDYDHKMHIFQSMLDITNTHTRLEYQKAIDNSTTILNELKFGKPDSAADFESGAGIGAISIGTTPTLLSLLDDPIIPLRLQTLVMSIRALGAALHCSGEPKFAFNPSATQTHLSAPELLARFTTEADLAATAEELWKQGYVWEAQKLMSFSFWHMPMPSDDRISNHLGTFLQTISARPADDDNGCKVRLAAITIIADFCEAVAARRLSQASEISLLSWMTMMVKITTYEPSNTQRLRQIETLLSDTRAFQNIRTLHIEVAVDETADATRLGHAMTHENFELDLGAKLFEQNSPLIDQWFLQARKLWDQSENVLGVIDMVERTYEVRLRFNALGTNKIRAHFEEVSKSLPRTHPRLYQLDFIQGSISWTSSAAQASC